MAGRPYRSLLLSTGRLPAPYDVPSVVQQMLPPSRCSHGSAVGSHGFVAAPMERSNGEKALTGGLVSGMLALIRSSGRVVTCVGDRMAVRTSAGLGVLALLQYSDEQAARKVRRSRVGIAVVAGVIHAALVGIIVWSVVTLRDAWHGGKWDDFWRSLNNWPYLVAMGTQFSSITALAQRYSDTSRMIREAALRGDEQEAPLAAEQPTPSVDEAALLGAVRYGPLKRLRSERGAGQLALFISTLVTAIVAGIIAAFLVSSEAGMSVSLIIGGSALFFLLLSLWPLSIWLRRRRGIFVTADVMGISWKQVGWRARVKRVSWHEAQAFFIVRGGGGSANRTKETAWVLLGPDTALVWMAPHEVALHDETAHARFAALVAARTRLPLRDLSALADRMTNSTLATEQSKALSADAIAAIKAARTHPEKAEAWLSAQRSMQTNDAWLSAHTNEQPTKSSGLGWGCTAQLVLMLIIALLYAGGWGLQHYQPQYRAGLLAQIHRSKPLYQDSLAFDNGDWNISQSATNDYSFTFKDGAMHMTGTKGDDLYVWPEVEQADAAVEVTARQIGTSENEGVGLVLRTTENGSEMVTFYVTTTGQWWLYHYHFVDDNPDHEWTELDDGHSDAIRTGSGAENRLLVVMRGGRYECYVNGTFVEFYSDDDNVTPRSGHMGVFSNEGALEAVFKDFKVYPVPAPSIWSAI